MEALELLLGLANLPDLPYYEIMRPECNKIKTKSMKLTAVEPQATIGMPPEQIVALSNPRLFQPVSVPRMEPLIGQSTGTGLIGQELGRDKVLSMLRRYAPEEHRNNAVAYGPPKSTLQASRDFRAAFGIKDYLSKYDKDNISGAGHGEWGRFPDIGVGVFFGSRGNKDYSDEGLLITSVYCPKNKTKSDYRQVAYKDMAAKFAKLRKRYRRKNGKDLAFYSGASVGDGDGMSIPDDAILAYKDIYKSGANMCIRWDITLPFPTKASAYSYSKNLRHNNEVVVCLRKGTGTFKLPALLSFLREDQHKANILRDDKLYQNKIEWAPPNTDIIWRDPIMKPRAVPAAKITGRGKRSDGILLLDNWLANKAWKKLISSDTVPPVPVSPIQIPSVYYAKGYEPNGLNVYDLFASFVHDPKYKASYDEEHGWCRKRNRPPFKGWPIPDVKLYATWITHMEADSDDDEDSDSESDDESD